MSADSTPTLERRLRELIDAARMYEARCRLGGKDEYFARIKLDRAKAAALEAADLLDRCKEALEASKQAIASLPEDALGMVQIAFGIPGVDVYPARDELLSNLGEVLTQLNGGRNVG